ncbi:hypothetical protein GMORB2_0741 [Geosmithia morbida]|uniref:Uncharacterized protein n=1 Tax=Geosmithia morbida TaxID=1094350 RepID=A0A9P4Z4B2_9HYPO|nr:uncharacterized protein GMORB2_0741 [Geosmithia morbida]KAF4127003.1 hypothetical protein GMORB2_0741 [Geosmithia morbida]
MISRAPRHQRLSISPISIVFTSPVNMVTDQTSPLAGYIGKRASKPSQRSEEAREIIETASEEKSGSIQEPPEENVETPLAGPKPTDASRTIGVRRLRIKSTPRRRLLVKMEADVNLDMSADGKITQASLDEQDEQDDVTYDSGHECSDSGWSSAESGQGDDVESLPQLGAPLGVNEEFPCVGCDAFRPGAPLPRKQPYILHSAYGHSVKFPEFDPTGRTGRYIPHHRDTIVGLKGILKPSTMRFKESEVSDDAESDAQPDLPVHYAGSTTDGNGSHASTQIKPEIMGRLESSPVLRGPRGSDKTVQHPFYDKATSPIHKSPAPARSIEVARAEALKRVHDPPPSYIMSKAMKPTIDRLKKRIEDGTEPSEQIRHVHLAASPGAKAVEAELEYRGLRTSVQKDMLFSELAREYSRLLAGSSECLLSMWRKMMGDLYDECLEIRRDLTTQPKPTVKPLTPLEALVAYGQGCTDESSVCTSDDEADDAGIVTSGERVPVGQQYGSGRQGLCRADGTRSSIIASEKATEW